MSFLLWVTNAISFKNDYLSLTCIILLQFLNFIITSSNKINSVFYHSVADKLGSINYTYRIFRMLQNNNLTQGSPSSFKWNLDTVEKFYRGPEKKNND